MKHFLLILWKLEEILTIELLVIVIFNVHAYDTKQNKSIFAQTLYILHKHIFTLLVLRHPGDQFLNPIKLSLNLISSLKYAHGNPL